MKTDIQPVTWGGSMEKGEAERHCANCNHFAVSNSGEMVCALFNEDVFDPISTARVCESFNPW